MTRAPSRRPLIALLLTSATIFWASSSAAQASDIEISVEVQAGNRSVRTAHTEIEPSPKKPQARPVFTVKPHQNFVVTWKATNVGKETFKDVTIHCLVAHEQTPGQLGAPDLKNPVQESALWMDFKPGSTATGKFSLAIAEPGAYLLRVETREMLGTHGHEHYAALDIVAE